MYFEHRVTLIYDDKMSLNRNLRMLIDKKGFTSSGRGPDTEDGEKTYLLHRNVDCEEFFHGDVIKFMDSGIVWTGEPNNSPPLLQYREEERRCW